MRRSAVAVADHGAGRFPATIASRHRRRPGHRPNSTYQGPRASHHEAQASREAFGPPQPSYPEPRPLTVVADRAVAREDRTVMASWSDAFCGKGDRISLVFNAATRKFAFAAISSQHCASIRSLYSSNVTALNPQQLKISRGLRFRGLITMLDIYPGGVKSWP